MNIISILFYEKKIMVPEDERKNINKQNNNMHRYIEISLRNFIVRKISAEYVFINSDIELVWNI